VQSDLGRHVRKGEYLVADLRRRLELEDLEDRPAAGSDFAVPGFARDGWASCGGFQQARARAMEAFERVYVAQLLQHNGGNITRAAREAQKDRRAFGRLVKKYRLRSQSGEMGQR
jgi:DNA-binding NtrC family response regulator